MRGRFTRDEGFSLVEVIIAMFMLSVLAVAILPLIIGATQLSATNREITTATAFANAQLSPVRDAFPLNALTPATCTAVQTYTASDVPGPEGLEADIVVGSCPASYPGTVTVDVYVSSGPDTVVHLPTRILVTAA
ncbi:type IV pilus modification PilV family protein [Microbacterium sp. MC2]